MGAEAAALLSPPLLDPKLPEGGQELTWLTLGAQETSWNKRLEVIDAHTPSPAVSGTDLCARSGAATVPSHRSLSGGARAGGRRSPRARHLQDARNLSDQAEQRFRARFLTK